MAAEIAAASRRLSGLFAAQQGEKREADRDDAPLVCPDSEEEEAGSDDDAGSEGCSDDEEYAPAAKKPRVAVGAKAAPGAKAGAKAAAKPRVAKPRAPKPQSPLAALPGLLKNASKAQLEKLVLDLARAPKNAALDLASQVPALLPPPDLASIEAELTKLSRKVYSSFPHTRWGSSRDAYSYKRVAGVLQAHKAAILKYNVQFGAAGQAGAALAYFGVALKQVEDMPLFDNEVHNKARGLTAKAVVKSGLVALKKAWPGLSAEERATWAKTCQDVEGCCSGFGGLGLADAVAQL